MNCLRHSFIAWLAGEPQWVCDYIRQMEHELEDAHGEQNGCGHYDWWQQFGWCKMR